MQQLVDVLETIGKSTESFHSSDGTRVLMLPHGGRVLGLYAPGDEKNFYWTHTALESVETARAFYAGDEWHNSGGDRTWLAPEIDFFFPKFPDLRAYFQPRQLDPGNYTVSTVNGQIKMTNRLTIAPIRTHDELELEITKSVGPAPNPLRYERDMDDLAGVKYAGYTLHVSLEILNGNKSRVGLWNLVQMPHGGDLVIPTYSRTEPKIYFGDISGEDLIISDTSVRYRMRAQGEHKLGIRAVATTGRVGYRYQTGEEWTLIIRNFAVNPSGEYIDVPWTDTEDLGYSTQACNVNSKTGRFSELEYHSPAIGQGTDRIRCDDAAQVWAFRGGKDAIDIIAHGLLGMDIRSPG